MRKRYRQVSCLPCLLGVIALWVAPTACTGDREYVRIRGGESDAGTMDGSIPNDGAPTTRPDGAPLFGDASASLMDGSLDDAGRDPNQLDPTVSCEVAADDEGFEQVVDFGNEAGFALTIAETGFGVALRSMGSCNGALATMPISALGSFSTPTTLTSECLTLTDVALVRSNDRFRIAWADNFTGSTELHSMLLDNSLMVGGSVRATLTSNDGIRERRPVLADVLGTPLLAFIGEDVDDKRRNIVTRRFGSSSKNVEVVPMSAGYSPQGLALSQIGKERAALAWIDEVGARGVWLQHLDARGAASGMPIRLTDLVSSGTSVDMAVHEDDGGAVVYSVAVQNVNREVRFRRLDKNGDFPGGEVKLIGQPLQASDASVARLGGGYVIAYRALPGGLQTTPEVRIAFITREGATARDKAGRLVSFRVAALNAQGGGRVTVRVSNDGSLMIAFLDRTEGGESVLRIVRKRLDCAL